MTIPICIYGGAILKQKTQRVEKITPEIKTLIQSMLDTMDRANGVGLAAPQIGRTECVCVIDIPRDAEDEVFRDINAHIAMPLVMVNPEITSSEGTLRRSEGCLSFPEFHIEITRSKTVTFAYTDAKGERKTTTASGLLARAVQHEIDHLNGILLYDRMSPAQRLMHQRTLNALKNLGMQGSLRTRDDKRF